MFFSSENTCVKYCPPMNVQLPTGKVGPYRPRISSFTANDNKLAEKMDCQHVIDFPQPLCTTHQSSRKNIQQSGKKNNTSLYKTRQCISFSRTGSCRYNRNCQFAHGADDVVFANRFKNFKTRPCSNYSSSGVCYFGQECSFLHIGDSSSHPFDFISNFLEIPKPARRLDVFNKICIKC